MEFYYINLICFLSIVINFIIFQSTKGVCYLGPSISTDNEKIVLSSTKIKFFDWPCKMHEDIKNRSQLREYWTIFLYIIGLLRKKYKFSEHLPISASLLSNCLSSILVYFIFSNYFDNPIIGLVISLLYITTFWPYHCAVYWGHLHLSQMFFLFSILFLQFAEKGYFFMFLISGLFTGISYFSSTASRKFPILIFIALGYSLRENIYDINVIINNYKTYFISFVFFLLMFLQIILSRFFLNKTEFFLNKFFNIIKWNKDRITLISKLIIKLTFITCLILIIFKINLYFFSSTLYFLTGLLIIFFHIFGPISKFKDNVSTHYFWLIENNQMNSHFNIWRENLTIEKQKELFGIELPFQYAGKKIWYHYFFLRMIPFIYIVYLISLLLLSYFYILGNISFINLLTFIVLSFLPIIIHESTKGIKVGKTFLPTLIMFLFIPAISLKLSIDLFGLSNLIFYIYFLFGLIILFQLITSIRILIDDTIKCKMAPTNLRNKLHELNIKEFYTYDNEYNFSFVHTMLDTYPNEFKVKFIKSLDEINKGFVVIPNTSSKSVYMESVMYGIINGDFTKDNRLNELLKNRKIEKKALAKIKTMGSSKYYVTESEVTSFLDLVAKNINGNDRWLGNGWIINRECI